jgi:aminoglycoside phosphotransferase (APT) family kinase protein
MAADVLPGAGRAARKAAGLGVAPAVLLDQDGVLALEYLPEPWRYARAGDLRNLDVMESVIAAKKALHDAPPLGEIFCPFTKITALTDEAQGAAVPLPEDINHLLRSAMLIRQAITAAGADTGFCHNDGTASNIMLNGAARLVDFDLGGDNDPWYDIGALMNDMCSFDNERRQVIELYAGRCEERLLHRCKLYGAVDDLMWGLWGITRAMTSGRGGIEFWKYGTWRLLHARTAIGQGDFEMWLRLL